jgi:membrane fusion protein (multidrug efflux system)
MLWPAFSRRAAPAALRFLALLATLVVSPPLMSAGKPAAPKHVIVAPVQLKEVADRVEALGTARANESVTITSSVTEKVRRIHFDDGARVKQGDVLIELDQSEEQANLRQAEALRGERQLALNRQLKLQKQNLAAADDIDRIRLELEQAEASIAAIKTRIDDRVIRAPFAGVLGLRNISVGALIETGDAIATLDDLSRIKLDFSVPAVFLSELKAGLTVRARASALANREFNGSVTGIDSRVDPVTRSIRVRAILPNPDGALIPGLLLRVDLLRNIRQSLMIPEEALIPQADKQFVMLRVENDGKETVEKRQVTIGLRLPGSVEITSGLEQGQQVITHGNSKVRPGDALDVLAVDDGNLDIAAVLRAQGNKKNQSKGQ